MFIRIHIQFYLTIIELACMHTEKGVRQAVNQPDLLLWSPPYYSQINTFQRMAAALYSQTLLNPIALRTAKTLWSSGHSECNRFKLAPKGRVSTQGKGEYPRERLAPKGRISSKGKAKTACLK